MTRFLLVLLLGVSAALGLLRPLPLGAASVVVKTLAQTPVTGRLADGGTFHGRLTLQDVAGMLRSFHYAAYAGLYNQGHQDVAAPAEAPTAFDPWAQLWYVWVSAVFVRAYLADAGAASLLPATRDERQRLLEAYLLEKAVYELRYELNNRPDWVHIPLQGIRHLWDTAQGEP